VSNLTDATQSKHSRRVVAVSCLEAQEPESLGQNSDRLAGRRDVRRRNHMISYTACCG
jgi:hypothetical protein